MTPILEVGPPEIALVESIRASHAWNRMGKTLPATGQVTVVPLTRPVAGHSAWFASVQDDPHGDVDTQWFVKLDGELRVLVGGDRVTNVDPDGYVRRYTGLYACPADIYERIEKALPHPDQLATVWSPCADLTAPLAVAAFTELAGLVRFVGLLVAVESQGTRMSTETWKRWPDGQWNVNGKRPDVRELELEGGHIVGHVLASGRPDGGDVVYGVDAQIDARGTFEVTLTYVANRARYLE